MKQESPIVRAIILSVLKNFRRRFPKERIERIDSELVPRVSEKVRERMMGAGQIGRMIKPIELRKPLRRIILAPVGYQPAVQYNIKIDALLNDASVKVIECPGPGRQFSIFRRGVRQMTKITMTQDEIRQFLERIAQEARIPLIEGIFRIAVDNFIVDAVVSEEIGSRFILKKF